MLFLLLWLVVKPKCQQKYRPSFTIYKIWAQILFILLLFFLFLWLCWVFVSVRGFSLVAASGGHSSSRCAGRSLSRPLLLRSTGSRRAGSVAVAHGPSCSTACGIFPDQGSNPCSLHWQADSQPLRHQGSPEPKFFILGLWGDWTTHLAESFVKEGSSGADTSLCNSPCS